MASCCRGTIIKPCARRGFAAGARSWQTGSFSQNFTSPSPHCLPRVGAGRPAADSQENPNVEVDHEEERRRGEIRSEREAKEREAELVIRLSKVEEEGERLGQEVARLAATRQELTIRRKESKMAGEQLMRLLETLDGISLDQNMFELRARRKKAAGRINSLMDTNDSNIQVGIQKQHDAVLN